MLDSYKYPFGNNFNPMQYGEVKNPSVNQGELF